MDGWYPGGVRESAPYGAINKQVCSRNLAEWFSETPPDVWWRVTDWKMVLNVTFYVLIDWSSKSLSEFFLSAPNAGLSAREQE